MFLAVKVDPEKPNFNIFEIFLLTHFQKIAKRNTKFQMGISTRKNEHLEKLFSYQNQR